MFWEATSFNQPLSSWDISSATTFVSAGLGACDSAACCYCRVRRHVFRCWRIQSLLFVSLLLAGAWLLCCPRMQYIYDCHAHEEQQQHHEQKQSNKLTILTLSFFFATSQYHHYYLHDNLEQYGTHPSSQGAMFYKARSFNQPLSSWDVSKTERFVSDLRQ
jgi:hypothetical protein